MEGSELTKEDRESQLYDDFEHFCQNKGETIHDYYVQFSKLINDMRNIKMTMSRIQLNSKFVNNMLPEWQHEAHANENKMMLDRFTQHTVDLLALMSNVSHQQYYSQSSTNPSSTYAPPHFADNNQLDSGLSPSDNLIENLTNTFALLTQSYKACVIGEHIPIGNAVYHDKARQIKCYNCNGIGHIARNCTQPKRGQDNAIDEINMIPYEQYVKDNAVSVVQSNVSSVPNDAYMMILMICMNRLPNAVSVTTQNTVVDNSLTAELATYKEQVELLKAEVDQNVVDKKHDEIERKNLLIAHDNLIADCLSKEVFYVAKRNSELNISRFTEIHDAHTIVEARCLELEAELSNLRTFHLLKDKTNSKKGYKAGALRTTSYSIVSRSSPSTTTYNGRHPLSAVVQPFHLEEPFVNPPVVPMADNRTMAQLLQAPTEGYEDAIVIPEINANFELKHGLINLVQNKQFFGHDKEDPHAHIRYFNKITSTMRFPDVPSTSIKLMLFPFSLEGLARIWLEKEPPRSILTWDDLVSKFINQFFPPSKTTNLRNEITRFQQRFDESFYEAWDRFNDLLRACPHHGFSELHQLDTFYNALNANDQDSLNSAAGGNFLDKMPRECLRIIESKSKVRNSRNKAVVAKVSSNSSTPGISPDVAALTTEVSELKNLMKTMLIDKQKVQAPTTIKAVEQSCVTCGGTHFYKNCPATDGNVYQDNIQEYVSQAVAANFNQGNTNPRPPMVANQIRPPSFPPIQNNRNRFNPNKEIISTKIEEPISIKTVTSTKDKFTNLQRFKP
ncbi:reverse transcriptase domain-containing protein [Tanacetum coccineum]